MRIEKGLVVFVHYYRDVTRKPQKFVVSDCELRLYNMSKFL